MFDRNGRQYKKCWLFKVMRCLLTAWQESWLCQVGFTLHLWPLSFIVWCWSHDDGCNGQPVLERTSILDFLVLKTISQKQSVSLNQRLTQEINWDRKTEWFKVLSFLVHVFMRCSPAASESCQRYFTGISDRFAKDTRSRAALYISLV